MKELGLTRQLFKKIMEKAVPLDPIGDQRITQLLSQLRDERERREKKKGANHARNN